MEFEIYEDQAGEWRWRLKAGNGEIVADSAEGYATKTGARMAAQRVRDDAGTATITTP